MAVLADGSVKKLNDAEEIIGSEGTLGVICELTLRLIDKPKADAILLLPFMDTESCVKAAQTVLGTGCSPAVVDYLDTDIVEFSGNVTGNPVFPVEMDGERVAATLMAVLEGEDDDLVMEQMESIAELAEELECLDILVGDTTTMKRDMWAAHDAFHTSMESGAKNSFEYNITVPAVSIAEMVEWVKAAAEEKGMKAMAYAHVMRVTSPPQVSLTFIAAESAFASCGLSIAGTPARMRLPVSGSMRIWSTSGTCFTQHSILCISLPPFRD